MHGEPLGTTISTAHADEVGAAKQRLTAVLADPRLRLPDVAAEVAQLAGGDAADDVSVQAALGRMLSRSDPAFKVRILLCPQDVCVPLFSGLSLTMFPALLTSNPFHCHAAVRHLHQSCVQLLSVSDHRPYLAASAQPCRSCCCDSRTRGTRQHTRRFGGRWRGAAPADCWLT